MSDNSNPPRHQKADATITFDIDDKVESVSMSPSLNPITRKQSDNELKKFPKSHNYKKTIFPDRG